MSTEVTDPAAGEALLDEDTWSGRIFSDGWVDAPETIESDRAGDRRGARHGGRGQRRGGNARRGVRRPSPARLGRDPVHRPRGVVRRAAELLERHRPELIRWLVREVGPIPPKADNEISASIGQFEMAASLISHPLGQVLPSLTPGRTSMARRVPVGVVGVICPWNFPVVLPARSVGPALALGNAVILKSDPNTPVSGGVLIARIFEEAGLPEGVLHVLGGGAEVGQALVEDPNVRMISFTGSTATGRKVGELAGRNLKRIVLELGGNSPLVVLEDADIEAASSAGAWGSFLHQGQICLAVSRHLVHESIADDYVEGARRARVAPAGRQPDTDEVALGPIINEKQVERVERIVDDSVSQGATLVTGGTHENLFFEPTVLADVTTLDARLHRRDLRPGRAGDTFGDDAEAVELANATDYGLVAAVQSGSQQRAAAVGEQLHAGMVHVNDTRSTRSRRPRSAASARRATAATSAASRTSSSGPSGNGSPHRTRPRRSRSRPVIRRRRRPRDRRAHARRGRPRRPRPDAARAARGGRALLPRQGRQARRPTTWRPTTASARWPAWCSRSTSRPAAGARRSPNEEVAEVAAANPDVMIPFASVDPGRTDAAERAQRLIADHDVRGFKFHPNIQEFFPNDRMAYPLYEVIAAAAPAGAVPHRPQRHRVGRAGRRRAAAQVLATRSTWTTWPPTSPRCRSCSPTRRSRGRTRRSRSRCTSRRSTSTCPAGRRSTSRPSWSSTRTLCSSTRSCSARTIR